MLQEIKGPRQEVDVEVMHLYQRMMSQLGAEETSLTWLGVAGPARSLENVGDIRALEVCA